MQRTQMWCKWKEASLGLALNSDTATGVARPLTHQYILSVLLDIALKQKFWILLTSEELLIKKFCSISSAGNSDPTETIEKLNLAFFLPQKPSNHLLTGFIPNKI